MILCGLPYGKPWLDLTGHEREDLYAAIDDVQKHRLEQMKNGAPWPLM